MSVNGDGKTLITMEERTEFRFGREEIERILKLFVQQNAPGVQCELHKIRIEWLDGTGSVRVRVSYGDEGGEIKIAL